MVGQGVINQEIIVSDHRPGESVYRDLTKHHSRMGKRKRNKIRSGQYKSLLSDFKKHISILGYSKNGQDIKTANVTEFLQWLECQGHCQIEKITSVDIVHHYEYLKQRPHKTRAGVLSLKTITHHIRSIRQFFAFLQESGQIVTNPMSTLKFHYPQETPGQRTVLTQAEIRELYQSCETLQEKAILSLGYGCGLRAMELVAVNMEDLFLRENHLIVPKGKGNKKRIVPLSPGVRNDLEDYIENERDLYLAGEAEPALLLNIKGNRLRKYTCRKILTKLIERTRNQSIIEKQISIHNLRHSIATHLLEQGVAVEQVRNFLGHAHLETTEIYTRINHEQLKTLL